MSVLAVQTLLVSVNPGNSLGMGDEAGGWTCVHGFPVESTFIPDAASIGKLGEVNFSQQFLELWEEFIEAGRIIGDCGEQ